MTFSLRALFRSLPVLALLLCTPLVHAEAVPPGGVKPTSCGPGDSGSPCDGSGPASQGNTSDTNQGAGNPINVITGNKHQREVDLPALPGVLGLEIVRHYNSALAVASPGLFGRGWRLSYETDVVAIGNTVQAMQADGTRIIFIRDPENPSQCATNDPARGKMAIVKTARGEEYVWTWTNGRVLSFNHQGKLVQIKAPTGEFVSLARDPLGGLLKVTDPQGRSLTLAYPHRRSDRFNGVSHIDSPVGRFAYGYGGVVPKGYAGDPRSLLANLVSVTLPDRVVRRYRHEDAHFIHHLTGISVEGAPDASSKRIMTRISTWAYDSQGRGILSVKGWPKRLDKSGKPIVGTGIEQVNQDFATGKTTLTNSLNQTTVYTHAIVGNEHRLLEVRGAGCASCGEANVRYGYDGLGRLTTETKLGADGQPIQTTKTGRDHLGRPVEISAVRYANGKPQPAKLLARYEYAGDYNNPVLIARPSVMPGKEAVTRIAYNDRGQPLSVTESGFSPALTAALTPGPSPRGRGEGAAAAIPITRATTYAYRTINNRSLLVQIDGPLANGPKGDPADSDVTRVEYDMRGHALAVVSPGNLKSPVRYDEAGRVVAVGQSLWPTDSTQPKSSPVGSASQTTELDGLARPVAWQAGGATLLKAAWGEPGTVAQFRMLSLSSGAGEARRLIDDFGRVVAIQSPGMGWQTAIYDAGSRPVRIVDPRGAVQVAQYDFANRLLRLERYRPGQTSAEETVTLRWQGRFKTEARVTDAEGERRTQWTYDPQGRVSEEVQDIALKGAAPVRFALRRNGDAHGERIELADAFNTHSTIIQTRDAQGRVERVHLDGALPNWLGGDRKLIKQVGWTNVAGTPFAERIVYGDGRADRWPVQPAPAGQGAARTVAFAEPAPGETGLLRPGNNHDIAGLPATIDTDAGRLGLSWDAAGRLAKINQGPSSEQFIYDAQGRRVAKRIGKHIRYFAYDGIQLAGEADQSGKLLTRYAYLGYRPVAQIVAPRGAWQRLTAWLIGQEVRTYSTSQAGRVLAMHDADGHLLWQDADAPAVRRVSQTRTLHQPLRDVGQYTDDESGLVYHMARFFDPRSGFFLSPDPKGIADAVDNTRPDLLLNAYAYAGGYPDVFFDPDGAAKLTYFAITSGANGRALGTTQGFTKARWAFIIEDVQTGGDPNTNLGQFRNQYASAGSKVLFDGKGNFIGGADDDLTVGIRNDTGTAVKWDSADGNGIASAFGTHYRPDLISIPQFTIDNFDDDAATQLIWFLMTAAKDRSANCKNNAPGWLPEISFAAGDDNIKVTQRGGVDANTPATSQRILNCNINQTSTLPVQYANDEERQRVERIEAAAEGNETSALNKDCSADGCPGIGIAGQNGRTYHASYGRSQFVAETFIRTLNSLSPAEKTTIGISPALQIRLNDALTRSYAVGHAPSLRNNDPGGWFYVFRAQTTCTNAAAYWDNAGQANAMSVANRNAFIQDTQLDRQAYIDMVCFVPQGNARPIGEGRNAFMTEAIFADATLETWLMDLYRSVDRFNFVSRTFIRDNLRKVLARPALSTQFQNSEAPGSAAYATRQREIERNIAMRVARFHNGGGQPYAVNINSLLANDPGSYVRDFLGARGNWPSLRCGETQGANATWRGLLLTPLILN